MPANYLNQMGGIFWDKNLFFLVYELYCP